MTITRLLSPLPALLVAMAAVLIAPGLAGLPHGGSPWVRLLPTLPAASALPLWWLLEQRRLAGGTGLLLGGLLAYLLGGAGAALAPDLPTLAGCRLLLGVGLGVLLHRSRGALAAFPGGPEDAHSSSGLLLCLPLLLLSGFLAHRQIEWMFLPYLLALPLACRPAAFPAPAPRFAPGTAQHRRWAFAGTLLLALAFWTLPTQLAPFLAEERLGDSRTVGLVLASCGSAAWLGGILHRFLREALGRWYPPLMLMLLSLGFALLALTHSGPSVLTAAVPIGLATGALLAHLQQGLGGGPRFGWTLLGGQLLAPVLAIGAGLLLGRSDARFVFSLTALLALLVLLFRQGPIARYLGVDQSGEWSKY